MALFKRKELMKEVGESGTQVASGQIIGEEYNWKLQGEQALRVFDEMRRNDATVNAALDALKFPVISAEWDVDAASEDEKDIEVRDLVKECLFNLVNWAKFLDEALTYLEMGFSLFEMVFEPRTIDGKLRIALVKISFRKQTTIKSWEMEGGGEGVTQVTNNGRFSIPEVKILRITHKQEGDNRAGRSLLRSAYKHWYIKDKLYKIDAIGHERQSLGVVEITTPAGAQKADKDKLRRAARNLRANESSYIEHPEGYVVEFMDMKAATLKDVEPSINHHDRQIMKNVLAQFLEIGASGSSGTKGASEDHSRLFDMGTQNVANTLRDAVQQTAVRLIVDLNFTDVEYPTLRVGKTSDENLSLISEAVTKYVTAGALHPRAGDENTLRKSIGWEEVDDEELAELYEKPEPVVVKTEEADVKADATVKELKALKASVEAALYEPSSKAA
ncbi:phage portal protein family protein [Rathayibacter festucae]|uniref:DUF935 domain-containing protein n=1 Tax=Rathayibacter festucae DSM 15932 TaxID=1328866 RepID=A0A3Q9UWF1_9MICO|nr:DUF935 family protein [Rathayibacter festucae]AZZ51419.1 hypothetical protein C1I64_04755 [Rathayibacter festucae DSM 15932]